MAQRRMFSKKITDTDQFLSMPLSSQALYFHLNMGADDEGFIDKIRTIQRTIGASDDDVKLLIAKGFLIPFESGVVVIRHWRIHNYIQNDRFQSTLYQEEKNQLEFDGTKTAYLKPSEQCIQNVSKMETQVRIGKDRLDKDRLTTYVEKSEEKIPYQKIIEYLNQATNKKYRYASTGNKKLIKARWNEGYRLDDFKKVIDNMVANWRGTEWEKYLQPSTLFRDSNFDNYLNMKPIKQRQNIPDWSNPDYKEEPMTAAEQAELERIQQDLMKNLNGGNDG